MADGEETVKVLNRKRGAIKARLTCFERHVTQVAALETLSKADIINLDQRIEMIKDIVSEYDDVYGHILESIEDESLEQQFLDRDSFEHKYFTTISEAKVILARYEPTSVAASVLSQGSVGDVQSSASNNVPLTHQNTSRINLPKLKLITFTGKYAEWVPFYDTFQSLIHNNDSLTPIQKFHYLRSCLESEALQVIQNLELTSANYEAAWALLERRYKNKQLLIHTHIKGIVEHPKIVRENFVSLRDLLDAFQNHVRSLKALEQPIEQWDSILIYLITDKFDYNTKKEWESIVVKCEDPPDRETLIEFLEQRCQFLEKVDKQSVTSTRGVQFNKSHKQSHSATRMSCVSTENKYNNCPVCNQSHGVYSCRKFLDLAVKERLQEIRRLKLCINCLRPNHFTANCKSGHKCRICGRPHNSLLHIDVQSTPVVEQVSAQGAVSLGNDAAARQVNFARQSCGHQQLLPTAKIYILDSQGRKHTCTALLDSGSMSNFMTLELVDRLRLSSSSASIPVLGVNRARSQVTRRAQATILSRFGNYRRTAEFLVLPEITQFIPSQAFSINDLEMPRGINLANPDFGTPARIDVLLGVDIFWDVLGQSSGDGIPYIHETAFGSVVSGSILQQIKQKRSFCNISTLGISQQLTKFWEVEDCQPGPRSLSEEEGACEDHFVRTTRRSEHGRFIVSLPLVDALHTLGESRGQAETRFMSLERRLQSNDVFRQMYSEFMCEYEQLGHMTEVDEATDTSNHTFYLPHHGVFRQDSQTTRLRVVFDGSCSSSTGVSINNLHMVGPTIQPDLTSILINFRKHKYVITADCTKMYRSVLVEPNQRSLQRILWRSDPAGPLRAYNLNTLTYGLSSSSFMAVRCLFQLAEECSQRHPEISHIIKNNMYVDDLLAGADDSNGLSYICQTITDVFKAGGFELRKWSSNHMGVLESMRNPDVSHSVLEFGAGQSTKTLGLSWLSDTDELLYKIVRCRSEVISKRTVLSAISQIFDPLGLLMPCTVSAKIFMQRLWVAELSWDDTLPRPSQSQWLKYITELPQLNQLRIPRRVCNAGSKFQELHAFCDASQAAYGACVYVRSMDSDGNLIVRLVCSKTRVAPLKAITVPRLELLGAQILCRLADSVVKSLDISFKNIYYWCDSTIVLAWINTKPHLLKTFVSNRVIDIQSRSNSDRWHYIPTRQNPADLLTRGISPSELMSSNLWWNGPPFLAHFDAAMWPTPAGIPSELPEVKSDVHSHVSVKGEPLINFENFSSLSKLERIMSYCLRFIHNCRVSADNRRHGCLTRSEVHTSHLVLLKLIQGDTFRAEINSLSNNQSVGKKSKLHSLNPILDHNGIIRVNGRLRNSKYNFEKKFPVLIPGNHHLTKLLIHKEHNRLLHAGPQQVLASLREAYWPLSARSSVRKVIHECVQCFRARPKQAPVLMGSLPEERTSPSYAFQFTGTDYAGPFLIKDRKGRGARISKCYVCIFVCFSTKAVHIELVSDLSTEAFILALRRFVSRRSMPSKIFSDNGTNFVGAHSRLRELGKFLLDNAEDIQGAMLNENLNWHFIPAYTPHMGGIWEAGVKSVKSHLNRVMGNLSLTFESFYSVLVQIEAVLNSRPLTPVSSDPMDFTAITPAHFLVGRPLTGVPDPDVTFIKASKLSEYQHMQQLVQHFWKRWATEYVSQLQVRTKWQSNSSNIKKGTVVIIKDDRLPPLRWSLGRIETLHPGNDGIVRVVTIRTQRGLIRRGMTKICPLPLDDEN